MIQSGGCIREDLKSRKVKRLCLRKISVPPDLFTTCCWDEFRIKGMAATVIFTGMRLARSSLHAGVLSTDLTAEADCIESRESARSASTKPTAVDIIAAIRLSRDESRTAQLQKAKLVTTSWPR